MATVEKGNVVLNIKDSEIERYLEAGFNVVNDKGEIIRKCIPTDIGTLRKAYVEHTNRIKELEEEIAKLKAKKTSTSKTTKTTKSTTTPEE